MWRSCHRFLWEERASVPITDTFFLATILMLGSVAGIVALQRSVLNEVLTHPNAVQVEQKSTVQR